MNQPFLETIRDNPHDDGPILVFADFLEERGDCERAEFLRSSVIAERAASFTLPSILSWRTSGREKILHIESMVHDGIYSSVRLGDRIVLPLLVPFNQIMVQQASVRGENRKVVFRVAGPEWKSDASLADPHERVQCKTHAIQCEYKLNQNSHGAFDIKFRGGLVTSMSMHYKRWAKEGDQWYANHILNRVNIFQTPGSLEQCDLAVEKWPRTEFKFFADLADVTS